MENGPGEGQKLPLTGGEVVATLSDHFVQPTFQPGDEGVGIDIAAGLPDFFLGEVFFPEGDVAPDRAGEQEHILQHLTEMAAEGGNLNLPDVCAVNENLTLLDVIIPADEGENGGLAGAGCAHEGNGLLGRDLEGHIPQYLVAVTNLAPGR